MRRDSGGLLEAVDVLLDAVDEHVDHVQIGVAELVGVVGPGQLAPDQVLTALAQDHPRAALRLEHVDQLDQAEAAVSADGQRDLGVHAHDDGELGPDAVLEPAHDLLAQLVAAARRDRGRVTQLEDLGAEVALGAALEADEGRDAIAPLQQPLEHAHGPIGPADDEDPGSFDAHTSAIGKSPDKLNDPRPSVVC